MEVIQNKKFDNASFNEFKLSSESAKAIKKLESKRKGTLLKMFRKDKLTGYGKIDNVKVAWDETYARYKSVLDIVNMKSVDRNAGQVNTLDAFKVLHKLDKDSEVKSLLNPKEKIRNALVFNRFISSEKTECVVSAIGKFPQISKQYVFTDNFTVMKLIAMQLILGEGGGTMDAKPFLWHDNANIVKNDNVFPIVELNKAPLSNIWGCLRPTKMLLNFNGAVFGNFASANVIDGDYVSYLPAPNHVAKDGLLPIMRAFKWFDTVKGIDVCGLETDCGYVVSPYNSLFKQTISFNNGTPSINLTLLGNSLVLSNKYIGSPDLMKSGLEFKELSLDENTKRSKHPHASLDLLGVPFTYKKEFSPSMLVQNDLICSAFESVNYFIQFEVLNEPIYTFLRHDHNNFLSLKPAFINQINGFEYVRNAGYLSILFEKPFSNDVKLAIDFSSGVLNQWGQIVRKFKSILRKLTFYQPRKRFKLNSLNSLASSLVKLASLISLVYGGVVTKDFVIEILENLPMVPHKLIRFLKHFDGHAIQDHIVSIIGFFAGVDGHTLDDSTASMDYLITIGQGMFPEFPISREWVLDFDQVAKLIEKVNDELGLEEAVTQKKDLSAEYKELLAVVKTKLDTVAQMRDSFLDLQNELNNQLKKYVEVGADTSELLTRQNGLAAALDPLLNRFKNLELLHNVLLNIKSLQDYSDNKEDVNFIELLQNCGIEFGDVDMDDDDEYQNVVGQGNELVGGADYEQEQKTSLLNKKKIRGERRSTDVSTVKSTTKPNTRGRTPYAAALKSFGTSKIKKKK